MQHALALVAEKHNTFSPESKKARNIFPFTFYYRAQSICPRCTAAYRLIV
jgi:hypothetical protein